MRHTSITIDQQALSHNLNLVKKTIPKQTKILAMVKANAYGHGIEACLPALQTADGLGVACFSEAKEVRELGWKKNIVLIEGVFSEREWLQSIQAQCQNVVHYTEQVHWALQHVPAADSTSRTLWLKLNTGMNRLGFQPEELIPIAEKLRQAGYQLILTSHFANADVAAHPANLKQIQVFSECLQQLHHEVDSSIQASLCNSAGILNFAECHYDWVRPGIMLYGSTPLDNMSANQLDLQAVMTVQASIIAIHPIATGSAVGYGSRFVANQPMLKGIVSIGYGDGYPRVVDNNAWVSVHSKAPTSDTENSTDNNTKAYRCPIIGRVAMDMIAIDLSNVPQAKIGDKVTLWGNSSKGAPSVDDIANSANTLGYELLCRMTQRPDRLLH